MVLFVSRLVWEKNLLTLKDIYLLNETAGSPYQFVIAGDGVARDELQQSMPNALFWSSLQHEALSQWYATSSVFCLHQKQKLTAM